MSVSRGMARRPDRREDGVARAVTAKRPPAASIRPTIGGNRGEAVAGDAAANIATAGGCEGDDGAGSARAKAAEPGKVIAFGPVRHLPPAGQPACSRADAGPVDRGAHHPTTSGTSASSTLALRTAPGTPAPGCVPPPTRYRLSSPSPRLWNRNHADCRNSGASENPAPCRLL